MSDTHNLHYKIKVPNGDFLIFAGDMSMMGREQEIQRFNSFLGRLPHKYKIIIAGNHDFLFETNPERARSLITNAIYLEDESIEIEGIKFYGSPWSPWFYDWAFNLPRGEPLKKKWNKIPLDTDILITHSPPYSILDKALRGGYEGCADLLYRVRVVEPLYHIFGHIHEAYGIKSEGNTVFINASNLDFNYAPVNKPIVFEL